MSERKDWRGTLIEAGSLVVFPVSSGKVTYMVEGRVIEVKAKDEPGTWDLHRERQHGVKSSLFTLKVRVTASASSHYPVGKIKRLHAAERVTVVG